MDIEEIKNNELLPEDFDTDRRWWEKHFLYHGTTLTLVITVVERKSGPEVQIILLNKFSYRERNGTITSTERTSTFAKEENSIKHLLNKLSNNRTVGYEMILELKLLEDIIQLSVWNHLVKIYDDIST